MISLLSLLFFIVVAIALILVSKNIASQRLQKKMIDYYSEVYPVKLQQDKSKVLGKLDEKIEYAGKYSVPVIITTMLILMILGSIAGLVLKNLFIGVIAAAFLGVLPVIHLIRLETKMQVLIAKTMPAFFSSLKTEFQLKNRLRESFIAMRPRVSSLIKKEYDVFISELDQNIPLHEALYKLGVHTKCVWFIYLGDLAEIVSNRQDKTAVLRILDDLSDDCVKRLEEIDANQDLVIKSGLFVVLMLLILAGSIFVSTSFLEDPYFYYVISNDGRKQLNLGIFLATLPVLVYFYRVFKKEAML